MTANRGGGADVSLQAACALRQGHKRDENADWPRAAANDEDAVAGEALNEKCEERAPRVTALVVLVSTRKELPNEEDDIDWQKMRLHVVKRFSISARIFMARASLKSVHDRRASARG